jgi:hypothetical protein
MLAMISEEEAVYIRSLADVNGNIQPRTVVEDARDPKSPLHGKFNWDVHEAAYEHWMETARTLIRFVKLTIEIEHHTVVAPYYVPDPDREPKTRSYIELTKAALDRNRALAIMIDECDRIAAAIRRAQQVCDVLGLRSQLDELLENAVALKTATERRRAEVEARKAKKSGGKTAGKKRPPPRRRGGRDDHSEART